MLTALSIFTEGLIPSQGAFVPIDRLITIKGSIRDLGGAPVTRSSVHVTVFRPPVFNVQDAVAAQEISVETDANGEISSGPGNQLRLLRSTEEEDQIVRVRIPAVAGDWVLRVPRDVNLIILKDWVAGYLIQDRRSF